MKQRIEWPKGKGFAFTVFDDTDNSTVANTADIYSFLADQGFLTTKSVWVLEGDGAPAVGKECTAGKSCDDKEYLAWLLELPKAGFEIALHSMTRHRSNRKQVMLGMERFHEMFQCSPNVFTHHIDYDYRESEAMYWGECRLSGVNRYIYNALTRNRLKGRSCGHIEGSEFFWGDICRNTIKYMRNFVFKDINTLKMCPCMPYHDARRPYVRYWFASSEGAHLQSFNECIGEANQDRLAEEGGCCIMYTHFASGFIRDGVINGRFKSLMRRLGRMNGWYVPVSVLLDHIIEQRGPYAIRHGERARLERRWLWQKVRRGTS